MKTNERTSVRQNYTWLWRCWDSETSLKSSANSNRLAAGEITEEDSAISVVTGVAAMEVKEGSIGAKSSGVEKGFFKVIWMKSAERTIKDRIDVVSITIYTSKCFIAEAGELSAHWVGEDWLVLLREAISSSMLVVGGSLENHYHWF